MGAGAEKTCRVIIAGEKDENYYPAMHWAEGGATILEQVLEINTQNTGWRSLSDLAPNAPWATNFQDELKRQCRQAPNKDLVDAVTAAYFALHEQYKIAAGQK